MSVVWTDIFDCRTGVQASFHETDGGFPGGFAAVSVRQPGIPAAGPRLDAGIFWTYLFCGANGGGISGSWSAQPQRHRDIEENLCRIYTAAMDSCGDVIS